MNGPECRKYGAWWAITQGLLAALVPQLCVKFLKLLIGQNFENADQLKAKPAYRRQLRALGVGLAAAGLATLAMERFDAERAKREESEKEE